MKIIANIFGMLLVVLACFAAWQFYSSVRDNHEITRVDAVFNGLVTRLQDYRQTSGEYPASLSVLSLTNTDDAQILRKITYSNTQFGYSLTYTGIDGSYKICSVSNNAGAR